jgi:hypothetical protein
VYECFGIREHAFLCESCWQNYDEIAKRLAAQRVPNFQSAARAEFSAVAVSADGSPRAVNARFVGSIDG